MFILVCIYVDSRTFVCIAGLPDGLLIVRIIQLVDVCGPVNPVATRAVCMPGVTPEYSGLVHSHTHTPGTHDDDGDDDRLSPSRTPLSGNEILQGSYKTRRNPNTSIILFLREIYPETFFFFLPTVVNNLIC